MINLVSTAQDAFNNPDSPIYYIVGALFLCAIIGALVIYIVLSNRKKKQDANSEAEKTETPESVETDASADTVAENTETQTENAQISDAAEEPAAPETAEEIHAEEKPVEDNAAETAETPEPDNEQTDEREPEPVAVSVTSEKTEEEPSEKAEAVKVPAKKTAKKPAEKTEEEPSEKAGAVKEPVKKTAKKPAEKTEDEPSEKAGAVKEPVKKTAKKPAEKTEEEPSEKTGAVKEPVKKTAKKTPSAAAKKPFIDRLLATKSAHGAYNSIKNTILSYPGMKAKLDKDGEGFLFGVDKKAALALEGESIVLYLPLDPSTVPSQFEVTATGDPTLPIKTTVEESKMDSAQRLVIYAMNVSMLSRNDRHRYVDYVQKAQEAKQRAKKK